MANIVTTYVNPDMDGVASALAVASSPAIFGLPQSDAWIAMFEGEINAESRAILDFVGEAARLRNSDGVRESLFVLVDTHHVNQLPAWVCADRVVAIFDHHEKGDDKAFPVATIVNERVGAACTVVAERFKQHHLLPKATIASLLQAGIVSNTLEYMAPSTTDRDRLAFDWLEQFSGCGQAIWSLSSKSRSSLLKGKLEDVLTRDVKKFDTSNGIVAISQLEAPGASVIASAPNLKDALDTCKSRLNASAFVVNLVDLTLERSVIVTTSLEWQKKLSEQFSAAFSGGIMWTDEIFLRKTHFLSLLP